MVLDVNLGVNSYKVAIKRGGLNNLNEYFNLNRKVLIVSDDLVPNEYVLCALGQIKNGFAFRFEHGEVNKNLLTFEKILSTLKDNNFDRTDCILALGGGLTSDIAGFAASAYMRGIDFYIVPTTLLSAVDASVGGKVAVNFDGVKNLVGAFNQPKGVLIDVETFKTLDKRLLNEGMAEVIKMAATLDKELFEYLEKTDRNDIDYERVIVSSLKLKISVVEKDEKEHGLRKVLNFGHTVGHAIEARANGELLHGECVAIGMLCLSEGSAKQRIKNLLEKYDLPVKSPYSIRELSDYLLLDKKNEGDSITICEVKEIGQFELNQITHKELLERLEEAN